MIYAAALCPHILITVLISYRCLQYSIENLSFHKQLYYFQTVLGGMNLLIDPLRIFVTVAKEKSFSRAADELYLSQPGVSLQIRNLENEFGTKLINRSSKHVELTQAREILYRHAHKILRRYNQAVEEINLIRNVVIGRLKIGASFTIGEYILPKVLAQTATKYPAMDTSVTIANTEEIVQALRVNHLDVGIVEGKVNSADFAVEPFMEDEIVLIVPNDHPLKLKTAVKPQDLQDLVWILRESGSGTRGFHRSIYQKPWPCS